jgi:hydroxyethylthiazole kinase
MAHAVQEVGEVTGSADALLVNLGTLTPARAEAMWAAGQVALARGAPIVLDPVGVGATRLRTATAQRLLSGLRIAVVRGNAGEIASLLGEPRTCREQSGERQESKEHLLVRGVESVAQVDDRAALAREVARRWRSVVAITGARDVISDGDRVWGVDNGHRWLTAVTGTGCMSSAAVAAFAAVEPDALIAAAAGLAALGLAAERAAETARGPASFKVALLDAVYGLTAEGLRAGARVIELGG